jgi:lipopolysaccharide export LptBFGC system permease protein LptF
MKIKYLVLLLLFAVLLFVFGVVYICKAYFFVGETRLYFVGAICICLAIYIVWEMAKDADRVTKNQKYNQTPKTWR